MSSLLFTPNEIRAICSVLAAIYHLGCAGYVKGNFGANEYSKLKRLSKMLGYFHANIHLLQASEKLFFERVNE